MRRPRYNRERLLQRAVVETVALTDHFRAIEVDQNPVPGGGYQAMTGHPDLEIIGKFEHRQFYIELKTDKGKLSPKQIEWHERARSYGAAVFVCRSVLEALRACKLMNELFHWPEDKRLTALLSQLQKGA